MPTPRESRAALQLLTNEAVSVSLDLLTRLNGRAEVRRAALLDGASGIIDYYSDGSAALALDFYEEERELAGVRSRFTPELVVTDRTVKTRRAIAWASAPMIADLDDIAGVASRLAEVIQIETARPYRDTVTTNRRNDPASVGWRRIAAGGCGFCRMLADKGAIFKQSTARFAAHPKCHCTAQPVFTTNDTGEEASVMQYRASQRARSPQQKAELRSYLATYFPD